MGGGLEACRKRDQLAASFERGKPVGKPTGWSPSRNCDARASYSSSYGGGENVRDALFGGGGGGSAMVTSSSAIGAGWGAHQGTAAAQARAMAPGSPVRGLRA